MHLRQEEKPVFHLKRIKQSFREIGSLVKADVPKFELNKIENFLNALSSDPDVDRDLTPSEQLELLKLSVLNQDIDCSLFFVEVFRDILSKPEVFVHCKFVNITYFKTYYSFLMDAELFNIENVNAILKFLNTCRSDFSTTVIISIKNLLLAHLEGIFTITVQDFLTVCLSSIELIPMLALELYSLKEASLYLKVDKREYNHLKPDLIKIIELAEVNLHLFFDQKENAKKIFDELMQIEFTRNKEVHERYDQHIPRKYLSSEITNHDMEKVSVNFSEMLQDRKRIQKTNWKFYFSSKKNQDLLVEKLNPFISSSGVQNVICQYVFFKEPESTFVPPSNFVSNYFQCRDDASETKTPFNQIVEKYLSNIEVIGEYAPIIAVDILESLGIKDKVLATKLYLFDKVEEFATQIQWPKEDERYIVMIVPTLKNAQGVRQHATLVVIDVKKKR